MNEVLKINESISTSALFYNNPKIRVFKEFSKFVNLTTIGNDIFRSCTNLEEVWFPPNITNHWYRPFLGAPNVKRVVITGNPNWL
nr:MAG TPA: Cell surface protein [Caudoviricetes sp.]